MTFQLLKHHQSDDIAMEIQKSFYVKEKDEWKIHVMWWNIGKSHKPFCMGITQKLTLSAEKMREWKPMEFGEVEK